MSAVSPDPASSVGSPEHGGPPNGPGFETNHSSAAAAGDPSAVPAEPEGEAAAPADSATAISPTAVSGADSAPPRKGPLSFLSGALTSGLLAWFCLGLSQKVLAYYALHPPHYEARVAQSIATALKTMIVGMTFLATFSFAFVGLGLLLVFLRSLLPAQPETPA